MTDRRVVVGVATKVTVGALGAVAAFATVASLFGGGWPGYLAAAVTFLVVFLLAVFLTRGQSRDFVPRSDLAVRGTASRPSAVPLETEEAANAVPRTSGLVCEPGPYEVEGGSIFEIELDVRKGERVTGHLAEVDGDDFDWQIVSERNLVALRNGEEFTSARGEDHVTATTVKWRVPQNGPWFLVLDTYGRSNARAIRVNLRRH